MEMDQMDALPSADISWGPKTEKTQQMWGSQLLWGRGGKLDNHVQILGPGLGVPV